MLTRFLLKLSIYIALITTSYYLQAQFREISTGILPLNNSSVAWGDYDNDGDLDLVLMGWTGSERVSKIYQNTKGRFQETEIPLVGVNSIVSNNLAWGDYDNDGYLDLLITGQDGQERIIKLYHNATDGSFEEINQDMAGVFAACVAWGDYDNDGDADVMITGRTAEHQELAEIYNNQKGRFTPEKSSIEGIEDGSIAWGDYDNDSDLDILISGRDKSVTIHSLTRIYQNNKGKFSLLPTPLTKVARGATSWNDWDNDGDLDILITGLTDDKKAIAHLYRNDNQRFTFVPSSIVGVSRSATAWGDFDNDGLSDILVSGTDSYNKRITKLYKNKGNGVFDEVPYPFAPISSGALAWGDFDNDGDLDIILTGEDASFKIFTKIYENTTTNRYTAPYIPQNLKAQVSGNEVTLSWDKANQKGITFNLCIGTKSGEEDIMTPMADLKTGFRRVAEMGNTQLQNTWTIRNLPAGKYYWTVQSVNSAFQGSSFAPEMSFEIR